MIRRKLICLGCGNRDDEDVQDLNAVAPPCSAECGSDRPMFVTTVTSHAMLDVRLERGRQDEKWGGPTHDDAHSLVDWLEEIELRTSLVSVNATDARKLLVEIAALAVAAVESYDRKIERRSEPSA